MRPVELETLLCGGETKVACGTPPDGDREEVDEVCPLPAIGGGGLIYHDYGRMDSTRGLTNPKSVKAKPKSRSGSESLSGAMNAPSKPPIIGLPAKIQTSGYAGRGYRRPARSRIFPRKRRGGRNPVGPESKSEPASPKVSWLGKVLSDTGPEREQQRRPVKDRKARGFWAGLTAIFRCGGCGPGASEEEQQQVQGERRSTPPPRMIPAKTVRGVSAREQPPVVPAPGAMARLSSRRRASSWGEAAVAGQLSLFQSR
ncbi:unnamed protein product [Musa acuminata subsp. malaccensis]|uniref:(wild Malaysian banana) hypothetical protein n=1 Tax=Musa acuminata subsp. malaccensis TaxID=214687 RepID=A0A804HYN4_MUSAM|nr:PREDICTED: uncharacterized protein LOC104000518 [Musa acuminata subsp. malaccensis]CAG1860928.1 unnamed protein product [Musa acuminata subsp. malaccensis]